jgi:hypothetical protein
MRFLAIKAGIHSIRDDVNAVSGIAYKRPSLWRIARFAVNTIAVVVPSLLLAATIHWFITTENSIPLTFRGSKVELVEAGNHMCSPAATARSGAMSVPIYYFDAVAGAKKFQLTQALHQSCSSSLCPIQVFQFNPDGSRRLLLNALLPPIEPLQSGQLQANLLLSSDGTRLISESISFALQ